MRFGFALATCSVFALTSVQISAQVLPELEHCFEGLVTDAFMSDDGTKAWCVEDGGRIRYRDGTGAWGYQSTPPQAQSTLRAIHFIPDATTGWATQSNLKGWAVGDDGRVLMTADGGLNWQLAGHYQITNPTGTTQYEGLRDVYFTDANTGWLLGLHGIWKTTTGGHGPSEWVPVDLLDQVGNPLEMKGVELYAIDILECAGTEPVIVACCEPGFVLRNVPSAVPANTGTTMQVVWNIYDLCDLKVPKCGTGPLDYWMTEEYHNLICLGEARFEPWDIEFQRKCGAGGPPLLVMVGGVATQFGNVFSSTDFGSTWVRECHECEVTPSLCAGNPDYNIDTNNHQHYFRHQRYKTLYGVALFKDGTGVASGYNGQHLVRQASGIWVDRSQFDPYALDALPDASLMTLNGAVCERSANANINNGKALLVGQGGQARGTNAPIAQPTPPPGQPAENWTEEFHAGWWRMNATSFVSNDVGWRTGQLYHIAITSNGGLTWALETIYPFGNNQACSSIAMAPTATQTLGSGVAVGNYDARNIQMAAEGTAFVNKPKILVRVVDGQGLHWIEPTTVYYSGSGQQADGQILWDVKWAGTVGGSNVYWACGSHGIVLRSTDDGMTWFQAPEPAIVPSGTFINHNFTGVAFANTNEGLFVGNNTTTPTASAFAVKVTGPGAATWTDVAPSGVTALHDVAIHGSTAYAVGTIQTATGPEGRVFSSTLGGSGFGPFTLLADQPAGAVPCTIGDALGAPALAKVAVASNGVVWVGGECGQVWRRTATGAFEHVKSQTDAHVLDMTPSPGGNVYMTCFRFNLTGPSLVRWAP